MPDITVRLFREHRGEARHALEQANHGSEAFIGLDHNHAEPHHVVVGQGEDGPDSKSTDILVTLHHSPLLTSMSGLRCDNHAGSVFVICGARGS